MIENLAYAILSHPMFRLASDQLFKLSFCLSLSLSFVQVFAPPQQRACRVGLLPLG